MNRWNAVFVSELEHSYRRYLDTKDGESFRKDIKRGLYSRDDFESAFCAALATWLATRGLDMTGEIPGYVKPLREPSFPKVYEHPTSDRECLKHSIPEFKKYNILITYFGEKE